MKWRIKPWNVPEELENYQSELTRKSIKNGREISLGKKSTTICRILKKYWICYSVRILTELLWSWSFMSLPNLTQFVDNLKYTSCTSSPGVDYGSGLNVEH